MALRARGVAGPVVDNTSRALRRAWHAVATSEEVDTSPTQVWLLGQPWCLARVDGGRVAAWLDRCPHRLAPLSAGCILDSQVECGYHGWRFGTDGRCTLIPAQGSSPPPRRAVVDVPWGVQERYGLVWIAPDAPRCDLHAFPEWGAQGFVTAMSEVVRTRAGAALLVDNFLDAAHFPFVHANTFGVPDAAEVRDLGVRRVGWDVETVFETWYRDEGGRTRRQLLRKTGNASLSVRLRLDFPETGAVIAILFSCTPETEERTRVYKLLARNDLDGDPERLKRFVATEDAILQEDLAILERFDHSWVALDRTVELHTRADRLSLAWRTVMGELSAGRAHREDMAASRTAG